LKTTEALPAKPLRVFLQDRGTSFHELGRAYADRYDVDEASGIRKVSGLLNDDLITVDAADRLCILLDLHPALIWGRDYFDPIEVQSIVKHNKRQKRLVNA
jgi:hypothetical protein